MKQFLIITGLILGVILLLLLVAHIFFLKNADMKDEIELDISGVADDVQKMGSIEKELYILWGYNQIIKI